MIPTAGRAGRKATAMARKLSGASRAIYSILNEAGWFPHPEEALMIQGVMHEVAVARGYLIDGDSNNITDAHFAEAALAAAERLYANKMPPRPAA
jgi:hypothetical protein